METTPQYATKTRRDRTALNLGLAELSTIIPELDSAERAQLKGILANALYDLIGNHGLVWIADQGCVFRARLTIEALEHDLTLDNAAEIGYDSSDAQTGVNNGE